MKNLLVWSLGFECNWHRWKLTFPEVRISNLHLQQHRPSLCLRRPLRPLSNSNTLLDPQDLLNLYRMLNLVYMNHLFRAGS